MKVVTVTAPTIPAVSISEAREQCALLDNTAHDALLYRLIASATAEIEGSTGARLMPQTLRVELDGFPCGDLDLGVYPVASITSVAYDDDSNDEQTLAVNTDYWGDLSGMYPKLVPVVSWPATYISKPGSVRITLVAGYDYTDSVPSDIRNAILVKVQESFMPGDLDNVDAFIDRATAPHKRLTV